MHGQLIIKILQENPQKMNINFIDIFNLQELIQ
jgi:hypothetical protein